MCLLPPLRPHPSVAQTTESTGEAGTLQFKRYFKATGGGRVSPWHDVPLQPAGFPTDVFNFVCEIPKGYVCPVSILPRPRARTGVLVEYF